MQPLPHVLAPRRPPAEHRSGTRSGDSYSRGLLFATPHTLLGPPTPRLSDTTTPPGPAPGSRNPRTGCRSGVRGVVGGGPTCVGVVAKSSPRSVVGHRGLMTHTSEAARGPRDRKRPSRTKAKGSGAPGRKKSNDLKRFSVWSDWFLKASSFELFFQVRERRVAPRANDSYIRRTEQTKKNNAVL